MQEKELKLSISEQGELFPFHEPETYWFTIKKEEPGDRHGFFEFTPEFKEKYGEKIKNAINKKIDEINKYRVKYAYLKHLALAFSRVDLTVDEESDFE